MLSEESAEAAFCRIMRVVQTVQDLNIRERRQIFKSIRTTDASVDTIFPEFGITAGEFAFVTVVSSGSQGYGSRFK